MKFKKIVSPESFIVQSVALSLVVATNIEPQTKTRFDFRLHYVQVERDDKTVLLRRRAIFPPRQLRLRRNIEFDSARPDQRACFS